MPTEENPDVSAAWNAALQEAKTYSQVTLWVGIVHFVLFAIAMFFTLRRSSRDTTTRTAVRVVSAVLVPLLGPVMVIADAFS